MGLLMAGSLLLASGARANPLYTVASQHAFGQVDDPSRFGAIVGYPGQCVASVRCWVYEKGTRSPVASYPEAWYLHVDGVRVMDRVFGFYVMDPRNVGWQHQVATTCPAYCFLDGVGTSSLSRDVPRLPWRPSRWVRAVAGLVASVRASGDHVLPNSLSGDPALSQPVLDAAGRASTEMFTPANARSVLASGRVWVSEHGSCLAKFAVFQAYRGRGDHFSCYEAGGLPWDLGWLK
jgi:hypothetical protein